MKKKVLIINWKFKEEKGKMNSFSFSSINFIFTKCDSGNIRYLNDLIESNRNFETVLLLHRNNGILTKDLSLSNITTLVIDGIDDQNNNFLYGATGIINDTCETFECLENHIKVILTPARVNQIWNYLNVTRIIIIHNFDLFDSINPALSAFQTIRDSKEYQNIFYDNFSLPELINSVNISIDRYLLAINNIELKKIKMCKKKLDEMVEILKYIQKLNLQLEDDVNGLKNSQLELLKIIKCLKDQEE